MLIAANQYSVDLRTFDYLVLATCLEAHIDAVEVLV